MTTNCSFHPWIDLTPLPFNGELVFGCQYCREYYEEECEDFLNEALLWVNGFYWEDESLT